MSQAVAQIGSVTSTAGLGSAMALNPYPRAREDKPFKMEIGPNNVPTGRIIHRKTGQVVTRHNGRRYR